jgi:hypothetical protein
MYACRPCTQLVRCRLRTLPRNTCIDGARPYTLQTFGGYRARFPSPASLSRPEAGIPPIIRDRPPSSGTRRHHQRRPISRDTHHQGPAAVHAASGIEWRAPESQIRSRLCRPRSACRAPFRPPSTPHAHPRRAARRPRARAAPRRPAAPTTAVAAATWLNPAAAAPTSRLLAVQLAAA